jgi:hypothetical protein
MVGLGQLRQEIFSLQELGRVKALGEPAVERCEQFICFGPLVMLQPQTPQLIAARSSSAFACGRRAMSRA